jgi:hypothetical protein
MMRQWIQAAAAILVLTACAPDAAPPAADTTVEATAAAARLIDSAIAPAVAGVDGWNYALEAEADLTGDGQPERVVLTARVELYRGRPAWDDGQPWQVYVEEPDGARTYLYAQRLQLGTLTMRLSRADSGVAATIILLEHLPDRLSVYEARYSSPGEATVVSRFQREVDPRGQLAAPMLP